MNRPTSSQRRSRSASPLRSALPAVVLHPAPAPYPYSPSRQAPLSSAMPPSSLLQAQPQQSSSQAHPPSAMPPSSLPSSQQQPPSYSHAHPPSAMPPSSQFNPFLVVPSSHGPTPSSSSSLPSASSPNTSSAPATLPVPSASFSAASAPASAPATAPPAWVAQLAQALSAPRTPSLQDDLVILSKLGVPSFAHTHSTAAAVTAAATLMDHFAGPACADWSPLRRCRAFRGKLVGNFASLLASRWPSVNDEVNTEAAFLKLTSVFFRLLVPDPFKALQRLRLGPNEKVEAYIARFRLLVPLASFAGSIGIKVVCDTFCNGLDSPLAQQVKFHALASRRRLGEWSSLDQALTEHYQAAREVEEVLGGTPASRGQPAPVLAASSVPSPSPSTAPSSPPPTLTPPAPRGPQRDVSQTWCEVHGWGQHDTSVCTLARAPVADLFCQGCRRPGHVRRRCPVAKPKKAIKDRSNAPAATSGASSPPASFSAAAPSTAPTPVPSVLYPTPAPVPQWGPPVAGHQPPASYNPAGIPYPAPSLAAVYGHQPQFYPSGGHPPQFCYSSAFHPSPAASSAYYAASSVPPPHPSTAFYPTQEPPVGTPMLELPAPPAAGDAASNQQA